MACDIVAQIPYIKLISAKISQAKNSNNKLVSKNDTYSKIYKK